MRGPFLDHFLNELNRLAGSSLHDPFLAFPLYILAGLAGSLFPCVYPLIPVTIGFLQKRRGPHQPSWIHPLFYWIGTVVAYALLGIVAAAGGGAFNTIMQNGPVITGIGFLFLFLTFAILDFYPLQFTGGSGIQNRVRDKNGLFFTGLMGVGAGFVASACVAPALVTMLVFIARATSEGGSLFYAITYGGFLSAGFGMGLGVPFFLAGVFGTRLPRSGAWMNTVKWAFGMVILLAALYQIDKGLHVTGMDTMDIRLFFLGLGLIALAVFLGLKPPAREDRPALTRFLFALFALVIGSGVLIRAIVFFDTGSRVRSSLMMKGGDPVTRTTASRYSEETVPAEKIAGVQFYRDHDFALEKARREGKLLFIDFYADWCANCKDFYNLLEQRKDLSSALGRVVVLKIKDTDPFFVPYQDDTERFPELQIGLPFFVVLSPDGELLWKTTDYRDTEGMIGAVSGP